MNRREFLMTTLGGVAAVVDPVFRRETNTGPLRLHPDNPHYLQWRGNPTVLITAGEHYGAVLNLDFNYVTYLNELRSHGFNLTRIFSGSYREVPGSFNITGNTLAPANDRFVCPWAKVGNRFDLGKWDANYFERLKDFVKKAGERGVVVELVLFCTMYDDKVWEASPMNAQNNANGIGKVGKYEVYSSARGDLFDAQRRMVRKVVTELNAFDNVYFEVCNEPYERGGLRKEWNDGIINTITETELSLPKKHLIAQGFAPSTKPIVDLNPHVSVLNFHAAKPEVARANYHLNKVLAFDETGGSDRSDRKYRTEGWDWMMAGGGVYDHLDFSFTTDRPDGTAMPLAAETPGGGGPALRMQLRVLKEFVESFDFIRLSPAEGLIKEQRITGSGIVRVLADEGKAYAIYVNGGTGAELALRLPSGKYKADWVNTKTGAIEKVETFTQGGENRMLSSPSYRENIAVRLKRQ